MRHRAVYKRQYQELVKQSRSVMAELIARMESTSLDNDSIARKMVELANALDVYKRQQAHQFVQLCPESLQRQPTMLVAMATM